MSNKPAKPAEAPAAGGGKKKGLMIIIIAAVLVAGLGGGGAWYFLGHKKADAAEADDEGGGHKPDKKKKHGKKDADKPVFVTLESATVNLADPGAEHFMQIGIDLRVADAHVADDIKLHMPEIRNGLLLLLSSKRTQDVSSVEGKNQLRAEIRETVNKPLGVNTPAGKPAAEAHAEPDKQGGHKAEAFDEDAGVVDVLLTSMVIQ